MRQFLFSTLILCSLALDACGGGVAPAPVAGAKPEPQVVVAPEPVPTPPPPPKDVPPPKIALVLGGGGARGFAHVGVLRVLEHEKVPLSLIVGTSVGSLIGALYAAEPNTFELEWKAFKIEEADLFDYSVFAAKTGVVKGDAIRSFVATNVKEQLIEKFKVPYIAVAADLNTGERVLFKSGSIVDAIRASVSIPGVFVPVRVGNRTLIDGGVVANLAIEVAREAGADIVIASNITQNVTDYEVNNIVSITLQAINIMMGEMAKFQVKTADVVVTPEIGDVGTVDFSQKKRCMQAGISASNAQIDNIKKAIAKYYTDRGGLPPPGSLASAK
jgi:NTE family protein